MYVYEKEREKLFTDEGQRMFLKVRDHVKALLEKSGAVRMDKATTVGGGDNYELLACVERLVEIKELVEITPPKTVTQFRVFVASW